MTNREDHTDPTTDQAPGEENLTGQAQPTAAAPAPGGAPTGQDAPESVQDAGAQGGEVDELTAARDQAADLQDQLARRNADMYNLQEEYKRYVRRAKAEVSEHRQAGVQSVAEALMGVLDDLALARQHGDLEGPMLAIADKLENTLAGQFAIQRFGEVGEEFNPMVHEALTNMGGGDVQVPTVVQVIQPGYKCGERILRAARVAVQSPA